MFKFASVALTVVIGVAGVASSMPANASPSLRVAVVAPAAVIEPGGYGYAPYGYGPYVRYGHGRCWRYRYARWHRHWDRW